MASDKEDVLQTKSLHWEKSKQTAMNIQNQRSSASKRHVTKGTGDLDADQNTATTTRSVAKRYWEKYLGGRKVHGIWIGLEEPMKR